MLFGTVFLCRLMRSLKQTDSILVIPDPLIMCLDVKTKSRHTFHTKCYCQLFLA